MTEPRTPLRPDGSARRPRARRAYENEQPGHMPGSWAHAQQQAAPNAVRVLKRQQEQPQPRQRRERGLFRPEERQERGLFRRKEKPKARLPLISIAWVAVLAAALLFFVAQKNSAESRLIALRAERAAAAQKHQESLDYYKGMRTKSGVSQLIDRYAREYQVEPAMISAIIARESHYDPYAESRVGARGLMQIMEDTGKWIAGKVGVKDYRYEHLFDPELNIRFGAWYLSYLSDHFQGNPVMVAAAYHAGLNNVNLWAMKFADDERFLTVDQIPKDDTKDYVKKVMNAYALYYEMDRTL